MGFFKRLSLFVFGLAGLLALAALVLPWYGPWQDEATALLSVDEYYVAAQVLVAITAFGLLVCLLRSIFTRNRKTVIVSKTDGDQVTVTRDAIASQATHVIEEGGTFVARRVSVRFRKHGHVCVAARVQPSATVDVVEAGSELHERLVEGLTTIVGENVDAVDLEFGDAVEYVPNSEIEAEADADASGVDAPAADVPAVAQDGDGPAVAASPSDTSEITVPMARYNSSNADDTPMGEE